MSHTPIFYIRIKKKQPDGKTVGLLYDMVGNVILRLSSSFLEADIKQRGATKPLLP